LCYSKPEAFDVKVDLSRSLHIDKIRSLEIICKSGWDDIEKAELKVKAASSGLRLRTADARIISGEAKIFSSLVSGIEISKLRAKSELKIALPYDLEDIHREITVRVELTSSKCKLDHSSLHTIRVELPLDVNVHDLFNKHQIFSRFLVRSSNGIPLRISDISLEGTSSFTVQPPSLQITPLFVLPKQPATLMYKIREASNGDGPGAGRQLSDKEDPLVLTIDYNCVDELASLSIVKLFEEDLSQSNFTSQSRLLVNTLQENLQLLMTSTACSDAVLNQGLDIPSFKDCNWSATLSLLHPMLKQELESWLHDWHSKRSSVSLFSKSAQRAELSATRRIVITVPLPRLHVLQTANLLLCTESSAVAVVGRPLFASLRLHHTRRWDSPGSLEVKLAASNSPLEFMYNVDAPADMWLVGGRKRGRFSAQENEEKDWEIFLVPLKTGKLLLPSVDVRVANQDQEEINCETDYLQHSTAIQVVSDISRTTVGLGVDGQEAILLKAET
jgi:hypothetical protein